MTRERFSSSTIRGNADLALTGRALTDLGTREREDTTRVEKALARIAWFADQGLLAEGREACADLLFGFQPVIAANGDLLAKTFAVFDRCGAMALHRRLSLAVRGTASFPVPLTRSAPDRDLSRHAPVPVTDMVN